MTPLEQQLGPEEPPPLVPPGHLVGADPPPALGQHLAQVDAVKGRQDRQGGNLNGHPLSPSLPPPQRGDRQSAAIAQTPLPFPPAPEGNLRRRAPRYQRSHFHPHTRVGCDAPNWLRRPKCGKFRSAPLSWGTTPLSTIAPLLSKFRSTPPRGGRPAIQGVGNQQDFISIPTPARGIVEGPRPTPRHHVSICPSRRRRHRRAMRTPAVWAF